MGFVAVGALGHITAPFLFGPKILPVVGLLPIYTGAMVIFTIASNVVSFHQIRRHYSFPVAAFIVSIFQVVALTVFHEDLHMVVAVMFVVSLMYLGTVLTLHFFYDPA